MRQKSLVGSDQMAEHFIMNIEIHIEELVLHGFPTPDRHAIGDALRSELTRLITSQGLPALFSEDIDIHYLPGGKIEVPASFQPGDIGVQVAQGIYRSWDRSSEDK